MRSSLLAIARVTSGASVWGMALGDTRIAPASVAKARRLMRICDCEVHPALHDLECHNHRQDRCDRHGSEADHINSGQSCSRDAGTEVLEELGGGKDLCRQAEQAHREIDTRKQTRLCGCVMNRR